MISLDVRREFLDKMSCIEEARRLITSDSVKGMNEIQLAREIYFHALIYYNFKNIRLLHGIWSHSDPIDIDDGGDKRSRRAVYCALWMIPGLNKRR